MLWYFDTSAVNALCDDLECDVLVAGLLAAGRVRTSSFAAFEIAATKNPERRLRLLRLLAKITECSQPFEEPDALVKRHLNTLAGDEHGVSLAVTSLDTSWNEGFRRFWVELRCHRDSSFSRLTFAAQPQQPHGRS